MSDTHDSAPLAFGNEWQVLGPFQIGTREATWGADPLEYEGGFRNLTYHPEEVFRSSLPTNGTASWSIVHASHTSSSKVSANASLSIGYSNVDWNFLKGIYGWSAAQYQAWARGELIVGGHEMQQIILYTDGVLEFWVDGQHYFGGDYYSFRRAPPVLHLWPGQHKLEIRLARDVRAFGGILNPTIDVVLSAERASGTLELAKPGLLLSDAVDGNLVSPVGSVYLRNSGEDDIEIVSIQSLNEGVELGHSGNLNITIVPGQTRPVAFHITFLSVDISLLTCSILYRSSNNSHVSTLRASQQVTHVSKYAPHKITFVHPGGMASYAMLRPPAKNASCRGSLSKAPVLLVLHGAGVEADQEDATSALDAVPDLCAWVLFPTGVTPWSSDDWHNWGFADVEAAIEAVPAWIEKNRWTGPGIDTDRWIVAGHSNGGQGTWYALTHRPDKVLAAVPVSGYSSIQKYVSYEMWQPADPRRTAVMSASLNSYRHEMLVANARGIPIQQQHGGADDNVPTYHSRFLAEQLVLAGASSHYNEVPGRNHWWNTVMTTPELQKFYYLQASNEEILPRRLNDFSIVIGDPGDMGSKCGITVNQLRDPGQYGKVNVKGHDITTSNVDGLDFDSAIWSGAIVLNGQKLDLGGASFSSTEKRTLYRQNGTWHINSSGVSELRDIRKRRHMGSMTAILRSQGPLIIRHSGTANSSHLALQISRNLHQYFQADSIISNHKNFITPSNTTGNVITLAEGVVSIAETPNFLSIGQDGVQVRDHLGAKQQYGDRARSAIYVRPMLHEPDRLELVLWGADGDGLEQAARLVPMMTGVGQPDFIVLDQSVKWRGIEGALAMGFFDASWKVTASSVVEST